MLFNFGFFNTSHVGLRLFRFYKPDDVFFYFRFRDYKPELTGSDHSKVSNITVASDLRRRLGSVDEAERDEDGGCIFSEDDGHNDFDVGIDDLSKRTAQH